MDRPSVKKSTDKKSKPLPKGLYKLPLFSRRIAAWAVEISLVAASTAVPFSIGVYAQSNSGAAPVPLNPMVATTGEAIAKTLALPLRETNRQVPPLTNLFWCGALLAPLAVTSWQLYLLGKTGQTTPKRWFAVRVVKASGENPGIIRAIWRELVGRWGVPLGVAYTIWRYSGAFPDGGILLGLAGLMIVGENAIALLSRQRRSLHDQIAGTYVLGVARRNLNSKGHPPQRPLSEGQPVRLEVQNTWSEPDPETDNNRRRESVTTIILTALPSWRYLTLWHWMREHPGITLLIVAIAGMTSVLGTFVGTQIYIQGQANRRVFKQQDNEVFLALVRQLSAISPNAVEERRGAMLALARLDDPRAIPFLVDLLGQEKRDGLIDAIQQSLVSSGPKALPYLQRLNQSLRNDKEALRSRGIPQEQNLIAIRQRATQRAIATILTIYTSQVHKANLSRIDLGATTTGPVQFTLVLDKTDLSGINFKGAILSNASLRGSRFYAAGEDRRFGTFDDWISDLSGAELKEANLTGAILSQVAMTRTNLTRAILNRADVSNAILTGANLSSSSLIAANLRSANLENASLTGADLANANFSTANLHSARLAQVSAIGAQFSFADLTQSNWQGADMTGANLSAAKLQGADFSSTKLMNANLAQAQLQNANLRSADLSAADLRGANVDGADFQGANFAAALQTQSDQFLQAPPPAASAARIKGVNFAKAKNLDARAISFICDRGGRHPQCR